MKQKISFTKSNSALVPIGFLLVVMLALTSFTTETFTALPDFQGGGKSIVADLLIIPSTLGVIFMAFAFVRLPKHIVLNELESSLLFDGTRVNNPVEVLLESNKQNKERFRFIITSQGQRKLTTGFIYKIDRIPGSPSTFDPEQRRILFTDN